MSIRYIFSKGERIGFLPWAEGRRLGAARWGGLDNSVLDNTVNSIKISNIKIPEFPDLDLDFPRNSKIELPMLTNGTILSRPQGITWTISADCMCNLDDYFLTVDGQEGGSFILTAMANEYSRDYICRVEERNIIQLKEIIVSLEPMNNISGPGTYNLICETTEDKRFSLNKPQIVELFLGEKRFTSSEHNIKIDPMTRYTANYKVQFESKFNVPLAECIKHRFSENKICWVTEKDRFEAVLKLDISRLKLEDYKLKGSFKPINTDENVLTLTDIYSNEGSDIDLGNLDIIIKKPSENLEISLQIQTPTETVISSSSKETDVSYKVKRKKIREWFESKSDEGLVDNYTRYVKITPVFDSTPLEELSHSIPIKMKVTNSPSIGFFGDRHLDWKEFLFRMPGDLAVIQNQNQIKIPFHDQKWYEQLNIATRESIIRNHVFRACSQKIENGSSIICPNTKTLLDDIFDYDKSDRIIVKEYGTLKQHYKKKIIYILSNELQVLYPRQQFELYSDDDQLKLINDFGAVYSPDFSSLPVCKSHGSYFEVNDKIYSGKEKQVFAYRSNSQTFTAPQLPGIYYLHIPINQEHYLIEIEVHGFIMEEI